MPAAPWQGGVRPWPPARPLQAGRDAGAGNSRVPGTAVGDEWEMQESAA